MKFTLGYNLMFLHHPIKTQRYTVDLFYSYHELEKTKLNKINTKVA